MEYMYAQDSIVIITTSGTHFLKCEEGNGTHYFTELLMTSEWSSAKGSNGYNFTLVIILAI